MTYRPTYRGFLRFCGDVGYELAPFQKIIARAFFADEREVVVCIPRGNAKSTLAALLAVHHVLSTPEPSVYVGAGSRQQARVIGRIVERFARHPAIADALIVRHDELRIDERGTALLIVASDGGKAHGWERPTLMIGDEVWSWRDNEPTLLDAMLTALVKNPDARFLGISTAASALDSPLGRIRARAMAQEVTRRGGLLDARGGGLRWLEWSVPEDQDPSDPKVAKLANPAPWITADALDQQRQRLPAISYLQFHCCRWGVGEATWLPPGAWSRCRGDYEVADDEPVVLGIDIGGSRASTAVVGVTRDLEVVEVHVFQGDGAVLEAAERIVEIAGRRPIIEAAYDPWRFQSEALRLERDYGLQVVQFPQSQQRMIPASENLHRLVVEQGVTHFADPELDRQIAAAVAHRTGRGWRIVQASREAQVDAVVALAMAVERAEVKAEPVRVVGWA